MDSSDITRQVVSPMPELFSYWSEPADGRDFSRFINDQIAALVASEPERFSGFGTVPLQDPDVAASELARCQDLGLAGIEVGSNVRGLVIGHEKHRDFLAEAASRGLAVFVHAFQPGVDDRLVGSPLLKNLLGFPSEIALAAASVITSGLLDSVPELRICFSHGGGGFTALLSRLNHGWHVFSDLREQITTPPIQSARRLWFDSLTYDSRGLHHLIDVIGDDRIMVGSDYPFAIQDIPPGSGLSELNPMSDVADMIRSRNAQTFLGQAS